MLAKTVFASFRSQGKIKDGHRKMFVPEEAKAAGECEKLCFVCGMLKDKDGAFTQAFEKTKVVGDLMEAIKKAQGFTCCTNQLKLWFATTTNDAGKTIWLPDDGDAADQLDEGEFHPHIRTLIHKAPLKLSRTIAQLMEEMNLEDPLSGQIHVLVEVPEDKRRKRDAASDAEETQEAKPKMFAKLLKECSKHDRLRGCNVLR